MKYSQIFKGFKSILLVDVLLCTIFIPISGAFLSAGFAQEIDLSPEYELVLTVLFSYFFAWIVLLAYGRYTHWTPQFLAERFQYGLLQVRDALNTIIAIFSFVSLGTIIQDIVEDGAIKTTPVGEGAAYFIVKFILRQLHLDDDLIEYANDLGLNYPQSEDPREIQQFEHGGEFMFWWALLASCVAKLIYLNSAFSIIRASEVFIDLDPVFNNDDEKDATVQEQNVQEHSVQEHSVEEESVQEQNDEMDSELSIQFQQDQEQGSVM